MDHQMNMRVSEEFGNYFVRLPLKNRQPSFMAMPCNATGEIVKPEELSYILGNPPFGGKKEQNSAQKDNMARVFADVPSAGVLDFVTAWYRKQFY
jgi:MmeI, DNA-methyltransferase domain